MRNLDNDYVQDDPLDMVTEAFNRCQNWPDNQAGRQGLAQGLRKAADNFRVPMAEIVREAALAGPWCPTDYALWETARAISLRGKAGGPAPRRGGPKCQKCGGSGWEAVQGKDGYSAVRRCSAGCAVPEPHGVCLAPEVLR